MLHIPNQPGTAAMIPMTEDQLLSIQGGYEFNTYYVPGVGIFKGYHALSSIAKGVYSGLIDPVSGLQNP
jgi:hypothetical protein